MGVFTKLSGEDAVRIARAHGLGAVRGVTPVPAGTVNSNYFIDTEAAGRVFVRLYEQQDVDGVAYEWALIDHLLAGGVPLPRRLGGPAPGEVRVQGKPVAVFARVQGEDLCQGRVTAERVRAVGAALGRAHGVGQRFGVRRAGRFTLQDVARLLEGEGVRGRPELADCVGRLRALKTEVEPVLARDELPRGVIHGDLFRDNVLWQGGDIVALLDWESASDGVLAYDVMVTVLAWCCGDSLDWELARALLDGYRSERALSQAEWASLRDLGRAVCLRFATTRITDVYLPGGAPEGYKDYRRFLMRLDALEAMDADAVASRLGAHSDDPPRI